MIERKVRIGGFVVINGRKYQHCSLNGIVGKVVRLQGNINDLNKTSIFDLKGELICEAERSSSCQVIKTLPPVLERFFKRGHCADDILFADN